MARKRYRPENNNGHEIWLKPVDFPELCLPVDLFLDMQVNVVQGSGENTRRQGRMRVREAVRKYG